MSLTGDLVNNWKDFKTQWQYYLVATNLDEKLADEKGQKLVAATLCSVIGTPCLKVMQTLKLTDADKKDHTVILEKS